MDKVFVDKIFKIGLLVLGFSFLVYLFCTVTGQIGRYRALPIASSQVMVIDTTNSDLYYSYDDPTTAGSAQDWKKFNPRVKFD